MKLGTAALCHDCRCVFDAAGKTTCPDCASEAWSLLARFLDREPRGTRIVCRGCGKAVEKRLSPHRPSEHFQVLVRRKARVSCSCLICDACAEGWAVLATLAEP